MKLKIELHEIGINYSGLLCSSNFYSDVYPKIHRTQKGDVWIDSPNVRLTFEEFVDRGQYGALAICTRQQIMDGKALEPEYVFAKIPARPLLAKDSLLWEACVQIIIRKTLQNAGIPNGAPRVRDIFEMTDGTIGYTMDIIMGAKSFDSLLKETGEADFPRLIVEGIFQVASMISILERELGFNHRDLRAANLLCRSIGDGGGGGGSSAVTVGDSNNIVVWEELSEAGSKNSFRRFEITVQPTLEFTLIDFSFTCFGNCKDCGSFRLNGHVYNPLDPCPKPGRDMFMFLAFLFAEFGDKIRYELRRLFKKWLHRGYGIDLPLTVAKPGRGLYAYLKKNGLRGDKWIYHVAGNKKLRAIANTNAAKVVADLHSIL